MSDIQYNLQLEKLCELLHLGELISTPEAISGGLLHRMYAIKTTKGKYAVKTLNPQIMLRPVAMQNYINSEKIASIAASSVPALPAKKLKDTLIHEIDKQFYLVFDWVDGKSLKPDEISIAHSQKIGTILADLHKTDFSKLTLISHSSGSEKLTDWSYYLLKGQEGNAEWVNLIQDNLENLYKWSAQANNSAKLLAHDVVISHRDLDSKNVLWNMNNPIIIDWESAGYINPIQDLTETAVYWSENEMGDIDKERFLAFVDSYIRRNGTSQANWRAALENGFSGKLGWLEYNLKRSLWIECTDTSEHQMGTSQVISTIKDLCRYADVISELEKWLKKYN